MLGYGTASLGKQFSSFHRTVLSTSSKVLEEYLMDFKDEVDIFLRNVLEPRDLRKHSIYSFHSAPLMSSCFPINHYFGPPCLPPLWQAALHRVGSRGIHTPTFMSPQRHIWRSVVCAVGGWERCSQYMYHTYSFCHETLQISTGLCFENVMVDHLVDKPW